MSRREGAATVAVLALLSDEYHCDARYKQSIDAVLSGPISTSALLVVLRAGA